MKVEELRIGNYVDDVLGDFEAQKIGGIQTTIYDNEWCEVCINWNGADECLRKLHEIKPIPLTEEWLEGFGFENQDDEIDYSEFEFNGVIIHGQGHYQQSPFLFRHESLHITDRQIEIKYVHQLQNLYFALTGEDLTLRAAPPKPKCDHEWTFIGTVSDEHCHKCGEWGNID